MSDWISINEVCFVTGFMKSWVCKKIKSRALSSRKIPSTKQKGKFTTEIEITSLSLAAQKKLIAARAPELPPDETETEKSTPEDTLNWYNSLTPKHRAVIDFRAGLIDGFKNQYGGTHANMKAIKTFCKNKKQSVSTVRRWLKFYAEHGLVGLHDFRYGGSRSKLTAEQSHYIKSLIKQNPDRRPVRIHEYINLKFPEKPVSGTTIINFLNNWKKQEPELWQFMRDRDKHKSHFQTAMGSESEKAKHVNHYWELDSTVADIICGDGKRYNLIACIDIFSRRVKIKVNPTSNAMGIAALLRDCLTDWGVPDFMIMDNGKDYASKHIQSICKALEIATPPVAPFTPEKKPHVERFFGTLTRGLLEELPGFCGHNVADRKAIESRRSFAQRFMGQKKEIRVQLSADELQNIIDKWMVNIYEQRDHRGEGMSVSPVAKAALSTVPVRKVADERALDLLLLPSGFAVVSKKGIRYKNAIYKAPALAGWIKHRVEVRRDGDNAGHLYVFSEAGKFICQAWDASLPGAPAIEYDAIKKQQLKLTREKKSAIKKLKEEPILGLVGEAGTRKLCALQRVRPVSNRKIDQAGRATLSAVGEKPEQYKSIPEQMGYEIEDDGIDYMAWIDDIDLRERDQFGNVVNE